MTPPVEPKTPAERVAAAVDRYGGPADERALLTTQALERIAWRQRNGGKVCTRCGRALLVSAFSRDSRARDGLNARCRTCVREARRPKRDAPTP